MNTTQHYSENRKEINRKMRGFGTEMSELSRLFQRVVMKGDEAQLAKLKVVLKDTNTRLIELLDEMEKEQS